MVKRLLPSGLRGRLLLLIALAIVVPIVLLIVNSVERRNEQARDVHQKALYLARLAAQAQERRNEGARVLLMALARSEQIQSGRHDACVRFVRAVTSDYAAYSDIGLADLRGRVVCHALPSTGPLDISDRVYFGRAKEHQDFSVGEYAIGKATGLRVVTFGYPVRHQDGHVTGVVYAGFTLEGLSQSLAQTDVPAGASVTVMDRRGRILARTPDGARWIGHEVGDDAVRRMAEGDGAEEITGPDGIRRVYGLVAVRDPRGEPSMFISLGLRSDSEMAAAEAVLRRELAFLSVLGLFLFAATWGGADRLVRRPIVRLRDATRGLASGDLSTRAPDVHAATELVELKDAFNQMAERLETRDLHLRQGQRLEAVGQLAGGIAHDFNNLLTVIIGYAESLKETLPAHGPEVADVAQLEAAAHRAAKLTHQLLAFSRRQTLRPVPIHLNDIVAQLQVMLVRMLNEDIRLVVAPGRGLGIVHADPAQVQQVIVNLAFNARDAMPEGGTLTIETRRERVRQAAEVTGEPMSAGDYLVLSVSDTGTGMDEATRTRVFEPFLSTKGHKGTGLGLATVYGIVKQSGGYVWCQSEPGRGTSFSVYLPVVREDGGAAPAQLIPVPRTPEGRGERVIVVEDEPSIRALMATVLRKHGYEVLATGDASEALARLEDGTSTQLLITDVVMPGMSGPALHAIAATRQSALRFLFVSGYDHDPEQGTSRIPAGIPFLHKPFTPSVFLSKVRDTLDGPPTG